MMWWLGRKSWFCVVVKTANDWSYGSVLKCSSTDSSSLMMLAWDLLLFSSLLHTALKWPVMPQLAQVFEYAGQSLLAIDFPFPCECLPHPLQFLTSGELGFVFLLFSGGFGRVKRRCAD